jgi:pimeloyl-ACP methyl ester carboxylesterase
MFARLLKVVTNTLAVLVVLLAIISWLLSSQVVFPPWYRHRTFLEGRFPADNTTLKYHILNGVVNDPKIDFGIDYENISIPAMQLDVPIDLAAWYVPNTISDVGIVFVHGGGGDLRDFLRQIPIYRGAGLPMLFFDCNGMGVSGGKSLGVSFGYRESVDAYYTIKYAREALKWKKVILIGGSVGGATSIIAAARNPEMVDVVIVENPFTSPFELWHFAITRTLSSGRFGRESSAAYGSLVKIVFSLAQFVPEWFKELISYLAYWKIAGFKEPSTWEPISLIDKIAPTPILIIHSKLDDMIPYTHSERLFEVAKEPKQLWISEIGSHGHIWDDNKKEYEKIVHDFLKKHLNIKF